MRLLGFFRLDEGHPFTGGHMLAVVLLFFGIVVAVNLAMVMAATGTFPGLVVANSYVASQHFNERIETSRARRTEGWRSEVAAPDGVLAFTLANRGGFAERRLTVTAHIGRPSTIREDRLIALFDTPDGYRAEERLPPGLWDVDIEARRDGAVVFATRRRVHVPPGGGG
jgi:nitrogen fixation protein FixH